MSRKEQLGCARCKDDEKPARYRAMLDRYCCDVCYPHALKEVEAAREAGTLTQGARHAE